MVIHDFNHKKVWPGSKLDTAFGCWTKYSGILITWQNNQTKFFIICNLLNLYIFIKSQSPLPSGVYFDMLHFFLSFIRWGGGGGVHRETARKLYSKLNLLFPCVKVKKFATLWQVLTKTCHKNVFVQFYYIQLC